MTEETVLEVSWLLQLKEQARKDLERLGFPTRRDEDWKYSSTDALLKHQFEMAEHTSLTLKHVPEGVKVLPMKEALLSCADLMKPYLGQVMQQTHGFHAQNLACFEAGFFIYVPEHVQCAEPLHIVHTATEQMHCIRHLVIAEASSELKLIESYEGASGTPYFTNAMTEVVLGERALVSHLKLQREAEQAFHVGEVAAKQSSHSRFESHSLSLGAQWVRSDTTVEFTEPHASCLMNGIYMPAANQHIDHHTTIKHNVPDCVSEQDYKGILKGRAKAVFNGKVIVPAGAAKTEAKQYNKNVLLSSDAEVNTKPELQIFTDDVVCAHGATVGQLDEEALFYLATRGIEHELAHQYLMRAFLADNIGKMTAFGLDNQLNDLITVE